jgi:hypothetical protein
LQFEALPAPLFEIVRLIGHDDNAFVRQLASR